MPVGAQQVRLARAAFPAQQEDFAAPALRAVAVGRVRVDAVHRAGEHVARLGVDFLHVEGVGLPDVVGVDDRMEHLRALRRAEGPPAWIVGVRGRDGRAHGQGNL